MAVGKLKVRYPCFISSSQLLYVAKISFVLILVRPAGLQYKEVPSEVRAVVASPMAEALVPIPIFKKLVAVVPGPLAEPKEVEARMKSPSSITPHALFLMDEPPHKMFLKTLYLIIAIFPVLFSVALGIK